jgi:DNA processing protein
MSAMRGHDIIEHTGSSLFPRLEALKAPPESLFVQGNLPSVLSGPSWCEQSKTKRKTPVVAIIGARRASQCGLELAFRTASDLVDAGAIIISGGALGIDAAAHRGALAAGGKTLVVLPSSIHRPLPRTNASLFDEIIEKGGAWISEYDAPQRGKSPFRARNRIIAALCDFLIVVEAEYRSGTAHTVAAAKKLGRPMGAFPWQVDDPRGQGCLRVFHAGGQVVSEAKDIFKALGCPFPRRGTVKSRALSGDLAESQLAGRVLQMFDGGEGLSAEGVCMALDLPIQNVATVLVRLELSGHLQQRISGHYVQAR